MNINNRIIPDTIEVDDFLIALTFVGGGFGEGIVINLGGKFLGLVDCCKAVAEKDKKFEKSEIFEGIVDLCQESILGFMLLTHPHYDHFQSMSQILESYGEKFLRICLFEGTTEVELAKIYKGQMDAAPGYTNYKRYKNYQKFLRKYAELTDDHKKINVGDRTEICSFRVNSPNRSGVNFKIKAIAPSAKDVEKFLEEVKFSNFVDTSEEDDTKLRQICNRVSVVLIIEFGHTRIVLGGDAQNDNWDQILKKNSINSLNCNLLKVSHHGSKEGNYASLLTQVPKKRKQYDDCIAVVIPYFNRGLPHSGVLEILEQEFDEVLVSATKIRAEGVSRAKGRYSNFLKSVKGIPRGKKCHITVVFDHKGEKYTGPFPKWVFQ